MKNKIIILGVVMLVGFLVTLLSCKKERNQTCKADYKQQTQTININDTPVAGRFYSGGSTSVDLSLFETTEVDIDGIISAYSITVAAGDNPIAIALFYPGAVDTTNLASSTPNGAVVYSSNGGRIWAQLYKYESSIWSSNPDRWGITTLLSLGSLQQLIVEQSLSVSNIVVLQGNTFPTSGGYFSDWELRPFPGPGPDKQLYGCDACQTQSDGECTSAGGGEIYCHSKGGCNQKTTDSILTSNSYVMPSGLANSLYTIRNSILSTSRSRVTVIDDYYYTCKILAGNIDLTLALAAYDIYQSNVVRKLANLSNAAYNDTILITSAEKTKLLNLFDLADNYSTETRYQTIIDSLRSRTNRFYNKSNNYVNSNF
jgi:hypothetical protein